EAATDLSVDHSLISFAWHSFGVGNIDADPLLVDVAGGDFGLKPDSGAVGTGSWGLDMGASVPAGAAISGEPYAITYRRSATLSVGGPGITHYKYSVNNPAGPWSTEISVDVPITLTGLVNGRSYTVYAIGKNSAGVWQSEDGPSASRTWTINTSHYDLLINEVLAHTHGADPDIIELYYDGPGSINLTGMSLSDDPAEPAKFEFNSGSVYSTTMSPGGYMILYGDLTTTRNHLGFALLADGEALYLYDRPNPDGSRDLIDSVRFGPQINDYSIGRVGWDREWKLNRMTFGSANVAQPLGDPYTLKINEWLADSQVLFEDDFIELYNPHPLPVSLGGLYLTDNPVTQAEKHQIFALSFIPGEGYTVLRPNDGNDPSELGFKLSATGEMIGLFDAGLNMIDQVLYGPQTTDVSQGRVPDGSLAFEFFELPTPGVTNSFVGDFDVLDGLRITELMYNAPEGSNYDYIELQNISGTTIQLGGVRFVDGITFEFPSKALSPGQYVVVVSNVTAFQSRYGYTADVAGVYTGGLDGGGEKIVLSLAWPLEAAIMRFKYSDTWYPSTDGLGQSLTINDATAHPSMWGDAESWHAAAPSPGLP
ncbi:MAG: lamin tail domain-containing protein, partial [Sedimentisphaerales bacterium]|nr:lamin tail domain-containing protein [Sedimentisphaerales bacterium]